MDSEKKVGLQKSPTYTTDEIKELRRQAGQWLRSLRDERGL